MSELRFVVCDWCTAKMPRDDRTDLYALGWRSLTWAKSEHMCPVCVAAAIEALKTTKASRFVAGTNRPVDINGVCDPLEWGSPSGGDPT